MKIWTATQKIWWSVRVSPLLSMLIVPAVTVFLLAMIVLLLIGPASALELSYLSFPVAVASGIVGGFIAVGVSNDGGSWGKFAAGCWGGALGIWFAVLVLVLVA